MLSRREGSYAPFPRGLSGFGIGVTTPTTPARAKETAKLVVLCINSNSPSRSPANRSNSTSQRSNKKPRLGSGERGKASGAFRSNGPILGNFRSFSSFLVFLLLRARHTCRANLNLSRSTDRQGPGDDFPQGGASPHAPRARE